MEKADKKDSGARKVNWKNRSDDLLTALIILLHLGGAVYGHFRLSSGNSLDNFFELMNLSGDEFFTQLFVTGLFLYSACLCVWNLGWKPSSYLKSITSVFAISFAISTLLSSDKNKQLSSSIEKPESFSEMFYILLTQQHALLFLVILSIIIFGLVVYYFFRTLLKVEYTGSGMEIKLPGQTMYYMPVYPQKSWQNTEIKVKEGEELLIELSGYVSPGGLQQISELKEHMDHFVEWQRNGAKADQWNNQLNAPTWPYTKPIGYKEKDYRGTTKLPILQNHPLYKTDDYYKQDICLTIMGLPHNKVIGYIQGVGDAEPIEADIGKPAYDWANSDHREQLICLSSENYPLDIQAKKSGILWIVINDVDLARWDNSGLFFFKLTKKSWK